MKNLIENLFTEKTSGLKKFGITEPVNQKDYLIDGQILQWNGEFQEVRSPVYFKTPNGYDNYIGSYPLMGEPEALKALEAARAAYNHGSGEWPTMKLEQRIACMRNFINLMKENRDEVVKLLMWEIAKSLSDAEKEFDRTVEYIIDTIEAVKNLDRSSSRFEMKQQVIAQIRRAPLGVVLCMGPFNYPLNETYTTLIPALMMGNTVIFKPPKLGVLLHLPLLKVFQKAFPKGVVNTVYGDGQKVIAPLMESGKIDVLAFIGSSRVADILKKQHPKPHRLRCILGLEAKNPAIILPDAEIDLTVKECIAGSLSFNGQRCTALKIIFVHQEILDKFLDKFCTAIENLKPGMPWDENVNITPLPESGKPAYLSSLIEDAVIHGARIINSSGGIQNKSFFFPAVLSPVNSRMRIYHEEQFGPLIPVVPFKGIEEPMEYVVRSNYGQQASIFGQDSGVIAGLMDTLVNQLCRVNINSQCQRGPDEYPFTGRKDSAEGTLSVSDALRVFSIRTLIAAKENDLNKRIISEILKDQKSKFLSTDYIF